MTRREVDFRPAFTLVELMISIAIALVLILGISQVFQISSATVGAGQAYSTISQSDRTAHTIMWQDIQNVALPTPALTISSQRTYAFRNAEDFASAADPTNPQTVVVNGATVTTDTTAVDDRSHRVDTFGFFASGDIYHRQTGSGANFVSPTTSSEAWIWYGHLSLPNNDQVKNPIGANPNYFFPGGVDSGASHNDNNRFASEFILGRFAILLVPSANPAGTDVFFQAGPTGNPLGSDAIVSQGTTYSIFSGRYDEALTSISNFASNFTNATPATNTLAARLAMPSRFQGNPFPGKPLSDNNLAGIAPIFIRNCSQFIVEYAGDYITQDPTTGALIAGTGTFPDTHDPSKTSVVDFVVDGGVKKIRWYGFPRSTKGDGVFDVVPLRDVRGAASTFEATLPTAAVPPSGNYSGQVLANGQYICSWGPDTDPVNDPPPRMIRITLALDDPNGRIRDPQVFEYVIDVQ